MLWQILGLGQLALMLGAGVRAAGRGVLRATVLLALGLAGLGFLIAGLFLWLSGLLGTVAACLWMGLALVSATAIGLVLDSRRPRLRAAPPPPVAAASGETLAQAFLSGLEAGRGLGGGGRRR